MRKLLEGAAVAKAMQDIYRCCVLIVLVVSFARFGWILVGKIRESRYRKVATALPRSWADRCTLAEPPLLTIVTLVLWSQYTLPLEISPLEAARVAVAAALAISTLGLSLWAFLSFPTVSTGHYVLPNQRVVTAGPYAWIRHPIYAGVFLAWASLVLAFTSWWTLILFVAYVVPGYLAYMRAEERMMLAHFGEEYLRYQQRTGMLLPRLR